MVFIKPKAKRDRSRKKDFLGTLPNMSSHYCRANPTKRYLEPIIQNKNALYKLYQVWCNENNKKVVSKWLLHCVFEEMNLSLSA